MRTVTRMCDLVTPQNVTTPVLPPSYLTGKTENRPESTLSNEAWGNKLNISIRRCSEMFLLVTFLCTKEK